MKVKYEHYRVPERFLLPSKGEPPPFYLSRWSRRLGWTNEEEKSRPSSRGGLTVCTIEDNGVVSVARAYCSMADNFSYRRGREIAYGRALKKL